MQPLIRDNNTSWWKPRSLYNKLIKYRNGKSICIMTSIISILLCLLVIAYFGSSSSTSNHLNNNNPARSFLEKPDNSFAYPSSITWKDPKRRPPPGGKQPLGAVPGQTAPITDDDNPAVAGGAADGTFSSSGWSAPGDNGYYSQPVWGGDGWKVPPAGTDGTTVNGVTYGGDDVALIDRGDDFETPSEGEVPVGGYPDEPAPPQQPVNDDDKAPEHAEDRSSKVNAPYHPDPNYPTTVKLDNRREIVQSDPSQATEYYKANGADDEILAMPYLEHDTCTKSATQCKFKQYSGYLLGNNNAEIHYWFIEAEEDPETKPVFFWTNGGPGCSGMDGLLTEHGPWRVTDDLKIHYNPHSWNTEVNMVYLEQPYGVGFSATNPGQHVVAGDQNAADDMDAAIRNFLTKFPQFKDNKVYLSSESWGGHYVPITSYTILQNNDNNKYPKINFRGFFLGNPYTDFYENAMGFVGDIYGHGLMKSKDWDTWRDSCWGNEEAIDNDPECSAIYSRAYVSAYNANVYALDWPQCEDDMDWEFTLNRPSPSFWVKDAHIHHAARLFMEKVLAHHDYRALKMSLEKSELQQLHDRIAERERQALLKDDDYYNYYYGVPQQGNSGYDQSGYNPGYGTGYGSGYDQSGYDQSAGYGTSSLPGNSKPEDEPGYNGMPTGGGVQGGMPQQGQGGMPPQQGQGGAAPVQGMPQQPVQGMPQKPKVPRGAQHGRPNHNLGNKAPQTGGYQGGYPGQQPQQGVDDEDEGNDDDTSGYDMTGDYLPCIEYDMQDYLNLVTVQQALHVKPTEWQMCSDTVWNAWPDSDYDTKVEAFYAEIVDNYLRKEDLTLTVYSGDDDSVCGLQGTQYWLDRWKYKVNDDKDYVQWKDEQDQLGGFYSQYMTDKGKDVALHFFTVRTAGHMVPTTQPQRALTLLKKYLELTTAAKSADDDDEDQDEDDNEDQQQNAGDDQDNATEDGTDGTDEGDEADEGDEGDEENVNDGTDDTENVDEGADDDDAENVDEGDDGNDEEQQQEENQDDQDVNDVDQGTDDADDEYDGTDGIDGVDGVDGVDGIDEAGDNDQAGEGYGYQAYNGYDGSAGYGDEQQQEQETDDGYSDGMSDGTEEQQPDDGADAIGN